MHGTFNNIIIKGIQTVVPATVVDNMEFAAYLGERRCKKQIKLTGVKRRHLSMKNQTASDYVYIAASKLMKDLDWKPADIDVMVFLTQTPDFKLPSTAFFFSTDWAFHRNVWFVAMSSVAAFDCAPGLCTYAASKAGIDAAMQVMSKELARRKIRVNSIQPTFVNTEMGRNCIDSEEKFASMPLGVIEPKYVAYLIEFLLSEKAKYISGSAVKMSSAKL